MNTKLVVSLVLVSLFATGCASSMSGAAVSRDQARQAQEVRMATVESVREVLIEGTKSPVGGAAGAVIGGIAGSGVGGGRGSSIASVLGAVVGGIAGAAIEEGTTRQKGLEITVKLEGGKMIAITQAADEQFQPGDRVRIIGSDYGTMRVSH